MRLLADAWDSLKSNQFSLYLYLVWIFVFDLLYTSVQQALTGGLPVEPVPPWLPFYQFGISLLNAAVVSAAQAVCFARMGKAIDRPLWKCRGDGDALKRFFIPWLILNLAAILFLHLQERAALDTNTDLVVFFEFVYMVAVLFILPVGAAIMYYGELDWKHFGETLRPLVTQFSMTLIVLLLMLGQYTWSRACGQIYLSQPSVRDSLYFLPIMDLPLAFLDCLAFAAVWRICMVHRDTDYLDMGNPFDL